MNMNFNFRNPTNLFFGRGALNKLGEQILPGKKALLLISRGLRRNFCKILPLT